MRSQVVAIAAIVLALFLGYRQWTLERRVELLSAQLGAANEATRAEQPASEGKPAVAPAAPTSLSERLGTVETKLAALRADVRSLEKATENLPENGAVSDQQILSVMKEQGAKVMEGHLKYHRERWLEQREAALNSFVQRFKLDQRQSDHIWSLLSSEIDKMMEILRKPESFEDPESAAQEWKQMLLDTDSAAHKVLNQDQAVQWDQQRLIERKALWPWLPE